MNRPMPLARVALLAARVVGCCWVAAAGLSCSGGMHCVNWGIGSAMLGVGGLPWSLLERLLPQTYFD